MAFIRQFYKKNPRIAKSCDLPEGFELPRTSISRVTHLGDTINQVSDMFPQQTWEMLLDFFKAFTLVFNSIMKERGNRPGFIFNQTIDKLRNPNTVGIEIRLAAQSE